MRFPLALVALLLMAASAAAQTTTPSCTTVVGTVVNPNMVIFTGSPDHATVSSYKIGVFLDGVNPNAVPSPAPVTMVEIQKSALLPGLETNCWYVKPDMTVLLGMPIATVTPYRVAVRAYRDTDNSDADWSAVSNPFVKGGTKPGPAGVVKITK